MLRLNPAPSSAPGISLPGPAPSAAAGRGPWLARSAWAQAAGWLVLAAALGLAPPEALLALGATGLLAWRPYLALALAAWAVPFGDRLALGSGDGPRLAAALPLLALVAFGMGLGALSLGRLPGPGPARPLLLALLPWLLLLAAAPLWGAPSVAAQAKELGRWGSLGLALWLGAGLPGLGAGAAERVERRVALVLVLVLTAGALEATWGLRGALLREGPEAYAALGGRIHRAHGHFGQPNPFGGYMNQLWPLALAPFAVGLLGLGGGWAGLPRRRLLLGLSLAATTLCGLGLLLSWSRGAWLAALAGGGTMALLALAGALSGPRRRRAGWLLGLGLALVLGGLLAGGLERLPRSVLDRLASSAQGGGLLMAVDDAEVTDANFAKIERLAHWQAALAMWESAPWLGLGPGHYALAYEQFRLPRWRDPLGHAHNFYLNVLAESGLAGLAALALFTLAAWRLCLAACLKPRTALEASLGLGLAGILAALMVHSLLDHLLVHDLALQLGLSLGLLLAARAAAAEQAVAR